MPAASRFRSGRGTRSRPEARHSRTPRNARITTSGADQAELLADRSRRSCPCAPRAGRRSSGRPAPRPLPKTPPEPRPISAWTDWKPEPWASFHGLRKLKMRSRRYGSNQIAASAERDDDRRSARTSSRIGVPATSSIAAEHERRSRSPCRGRARAGSARRRRRDEADRLRQLPERLRRRPAREVARPPRPRARASRARTAGTRPGRAGASVARR